MSRRNNHSLPQILPAFEKSHAFLIGINDYKHCQRLQTAVNDAEAVLAVLKEYHGYHVHPILKNEAATAAAMLHLLEKTIPQSVGQNDRVVLYFAGHGVIRPVKDDPEGYEGDDGFLIPVDADPGLDSNDGLIAMRYVNKAIEQLPCRHVLIILDCCYAGAFSWAVNTRHQGMPKLVHQERLERYLKDHAWQVITSSAHEQNAIDSFRQRPVGEREVAGQEHSPFAEAIIRGLKGAADIIPTDRKDGVITASELHKYLWSEVESAVMRYETTIRQTPQLIPMQKHGKGEYIFFSPGHALQLPSVPGENPYRGLSAYEYSDRQWFFGRERVVKELRHALDACRLLIVAGISGSGKSSVVKAGLIPSLKAAGWDILGLKADTDQKSWRVFRPGTQPGTALRALLDKVNIPDQHPAVLLIDQLEELYTRCFEQEERQDFTDQLKELLERNPSVKVICTLRSDFLPITQELAKRTGERVEQYDVPALTSAEWREIILQPANQEVWQFESEELVNEIVRQVVDRPGSLPLVSFLMENWVKACKGEEGNVLTTQAYQELEGVNGALKYKLMQQFEKAESDPDNPTLRLEALRNLLCRMVSVQGSEWTGKRVFQHELIFDAPELSIAVEEMGRSLVDDRLIVTGSETASMHGHEEVIQYFEPAHDTLLHVWRQIDDEWVTAHAYDTISLLHKLQLGIQDYEKYQPAIIQADSLWKKLSKSWRLFRQRQAHKKYLWHEHPLLDVAIVMNKSRPYKTPSV